MSELLRYSFKPDETMKFSLRFTLVVEMPGTQAVASVAAVKGIVRVVEAHPDAGASLLVQTEVTEAGDLREFMGDERALYRISKRGELLSAEPSPPAVPYVVFPVAPVERKKLWNSVEKVSNRNVLMSHTMGAAEQSGGERVVPLFSEGKAGGDPSVEFLGVRLFSVARGRPVVQRCVIKYQWTSGARSTMVVEQTFEKRNGEQGSEDPAHDVEDLKGD